MEYKTTGVINDIIGTQALTCVINVIIGTQALTCVINVIIGTPLPALDTPAGRLVLLVVRVGADCPPCTACWGAIVIVGSGQIMTIEIHIIQ